MGVESTNRIERAIGKKRTKKDEREVFRKSSDPVFC